MSLTFMSYRPAEVEVQRFMADQVSLIGVNTFNRHFFIGVIIVVHCRWLVR